MTCNNNVMKGDEFAFLARDDDDTAWELVGGVRSRSISNTNPSTEITSSTTQGSYTERQYTGYSDQPITVSGTADTRTGITDAATGLNIVGFNRLLQISYSANRCGKFKLISLNPGVTYEIEGEFILSLNTSGDTTDILTFDATLENKSAPTVTTA